MYAIKEATIAKEHAGEDLDRAIFFMGYADAVGKEFERFYDKAKDKHGVRFVRSRVHTIDPLPGGNELPSGMSRKGEMMTETFDRRSFFPSAIRRPCRNWWISPGGSILILPWQLCKDRCVQPGGNVQKRTFRMRRLPGSQRYSPSP
ncbi:MAG: hypothetical protein R2875_15670 [Desulfobacterales bacterium]